MKASGLSRSNSCFAVALFAATSLWHGSIQASNGSDWSQALQFHGFLTQGYVNTTANSFFGDSEDGSFEFTEVGINSSYRPSPDLLFSAQLLARNAGQMYDAFPIELDYGLIDYTLVSGESSRFGLILGRFKNPLGLYNETRDVAATRPSIFLPQAIYFDKVRNLILSSDGGLMYGDIDFERHHFSLRIGGGQPQIDKNVEAAFLVRDREGELEEQGPIYGGRLLYEWEGGRIRMALSGATGEVKFNRAASDPLGNGKVQFDYWIASFQYNADRWSFTTEYMQEPITLGDFKTLPAGFSPLEGQLLDQWDPTVEGYYFQGSYRLHRDWELMLRYESGDADMSDSDSVFIESWTLGLLWEPIENLTVRAEYHWLNGTFTLSTIENSDPNSLVEDWEMLSLLLSYHF